MWLGPIFECNEGTSISVWYILDRVVHCKEGDDEMAIISNEESISKTSLLNDLTQNGSFIIPSYICKELFWTDSKILYRLNKRIYCEQPTFKKTPYFEQNSYEESSKYCIFEPDNWDKTTNYTSGEHLVSCEEFDCSDKFFKCPGFYCVPWRYVCDMSWECPGGTDEKLCKRSVEQTSCPGQFSCTNSVICVAISDICNGVPDCPNHNDELFCFPVIPDCVPHCLSSDIFPALKSL